MQLGGPADTINRAGAMDSQPASQLGGKGLRLVISAHKSPLPVQRDRDDHVRPDAVNRRMPRIEQDVHKATRKPRIAGRLEANAQLADRPLIGTEGDGGIESKGAAPA